MNKEQLAEHRRKGVSNIMTAGITQDPDMAEQLIDLCDHAAQQAFDTIMRISRTAPDGYDSVVAWTAIGTLTCMMREKNPTMFAMVMSCPVDN